MTIFTNPPFPKRKNALRWIMRTFIFLFCASVFSFTPKSVFSQNAKIIIPADKTVSIDEVFDMISGQTDYTFIYHAHIFKNTPKIHLKQGTILANKLLEESLSIDDFNFEVRENNTIVITQKTTDKVRQDPIRVTGKVTDEAGAPLPGVTVRIAGTNRGVASDFDGNFAITVPNSATILEFTSIGFATQEITVGNQTILNVTMQEAVNELDEVVLNAGYYNTTKKEATGSIAKVEAKSIEKQPVSNPLAAMQGRMAGVTITQTTGVPGGGFDINIRGLNSLRREGNKPLVLIDGMPFSTETLSNFQVGGSLFAPGSGVSALNSINPSDIESIEILKDADATAIYGSRGANGVVLITTKKGESGKTEFSVNMYSGFSTVEKRLDLMNTEQFIEMRREGVVNDGFGTFLENPAFDTFWPDIKIWDQNRNTDWQEELIGGTAHTTNMQASVSGGNENTQFLLSGGYHKETTVFPGDFDYGKISAHLKLSHVSNNDRFKLSFSSSYVTDKNNLLDQDLTGESLRLQPNAPALYDEEGNLNWENSTWINPLAKLERKYLGKTNNLISNAELEYKLGKGLILKTNLGFNTIDFRESSAIPSTVFDPALGRGSEFSVLFLNNTSRRSWIIEPQINWNMELGKGKLDLLAGTTFQERTSDIFVQKGTGFPNNSLIDNIGAASTFRIFESGNTEYRYSALFGRINYNFDGKYILNLTGRRDGSSRFGPGKQFANFGAIGAAWIFSKESFLKDNPVLSFGKLRGSFGITGSDQIGDYQFLDTYSLVDGVNYEGTTPLTPTQLFNSDFAWENNEKLEFALDLGLLKDRIFLSAAYYRNESSNQLVGLPLSRLTGFTSIQTNFPATVQNTGLEFELNTNVRKGEFRWESNLNITIPKNKLVAFPDLDQSDAYKNTLVVGEPLNIVKLYESTGVDPDTGVYSFTDFNNDDIINQDDRQVIQSLDPKFYGGFNNSFTYKGLQFDFLFQFVKQTGPNFAATGGILGGTANSAAIYIKDRWQEAGNIASIQRYTFGLNNDAVAGFFNYRNSDLAYTDASFIRLKNVSLSYELSKKWTKEFKVRLYLLGQNLITITDYFGLDPENQARRLPPLKTITLGAHFTF